MAYLGLVPSEHSSGTRTQRGRITRAGNGQARTMLIEAGWAYWLPAREAQCYRDRVKDLADDNQAIGWKAQVRLCQRFRRLVATGKPQPKVTTAIARELVGYAWDIARHVSPIVAGCPSSSGNERRRQRRVCIALAGVPRALNCDGQSTTYVGAGLADARS